MTTPALSPVARHALTGILALTIEDLHFRLLEQHPELADQTDAEYAAAMQELQQAGLIRYFPAETPGTEGHAIPGPHAFDEAFRLFHADLERLAADQGKVFEGLG